MACRPITVFIPCHTLDDFPTWLDEAEAEGLLCAWTAAWHPAVIAAAGSRPDWASVDLRPPEGDRVGIVPPFCDERFAAQAEADDAGRWVRGVAGLEASAAALARTLGLAAGGPLPGAAAAEPFFALGLATLLAELLAHRMRSSADLESTGFDTAVVTAARAAASGDEAAAAAGLDEAFRCLEATRARYYPVASWAIDLVLLVPAIRAAAIEDALASPVPLAVVATGETIRQLAERQPDAVAALRTAVMDGRAEACGGRDDEHGLDLCSPEAIRTSFALGRAAWLEHVGAPPSCYAALAGGSSALLPQVLAGHRYDSALWSLFDGTPLPDPGGSRIRWEGGGAGVEGVARPPLAAGGAQAVLQLVDRLGDGLDHDHHAVVQFAHYAGTATRWHRLLRLIGGRCGLIGTFVTPSGLVAETTGSGIQASFEPDAFVPTSPPDESAADPVAAAAAAIRQDSVRLGQQAGRLAGLVAHGRRPVAAAAAAPARRPGAATGGPGWLSGIFRRRRVDDTRALDNGFLRLVVHPRTGGILSLRRPADRGNRISQQLALRSTLAARPGQWTSPEERARWTRMEADAIDREGAEAGGGIVSRGRLLDDGGREAGRYRQRVSLVPGLPLAVLEIDVTLVAPLSGPAWESHVACRFAWHENEDVEIRRSLHLQSVATERTRFTAPHFIEVVPEASRTGPGGESVAILTGGLPWHVRSSPHGLDCLLAAGGSTAASRLAVGIGLERPWDLGLALAAGGQPAVGPVLPPNVRLTVGLHGGPGAGSGLTLGVVESAGRAGDVRIEWERPVARAVAVDLDGHPRPEVHVAVDGRSTTFFLHRHQWLQLALEFGESGRESDRDA